MHRTNVEEMADDLKGGNEDPIGRLRFWGDEGEECAVHKFELVSAVQVAMRGIMETMEWSMKDWGFDYLAIV